MEDKAEQKEITKLVIRPPIVVVMGHIDHGKTKILDWYRKTKLVEEETGGITQHIGAYEVEHHGKKITFIDTPGHEAFSKIRSRGARVADMAILVIAADEGVKPQTKEALEIIQKNNLPFVVAFNKIDKPEANPERVKQQLAEANVLVESYGGKVPAVEISAKSGQNMDGLLEILLLLAELENLQADPQKPAEGVVIEVHPNPQRGITATLLLRDGKLKRGDKLVIGNNMETIKILENFRGHTVGELGPCSPALVVGLSVAPAVGEVFHAFNSKEKAETFMATLPEKTATPANREVTKSEIEGRPVFNIILKADVSGSVEALEETLKKLDSEIVGINILRSGIGDINESDVKLALATKLITIVGFKVAVDAAVQEFAKNANIHILKGEIIYDLLDEVKRVIENMIPPIIKRTNLGRAKILKIFKKDGTKQIVGGRMEEGTIKKGTSVEIKRGKEVLGRGNIVELQRNKQEAEEVGQGSEFGILVDSKTAIKEGDTLDIFQEEIIKRML